MRLTKRTLVENTSEAGLCVGLRKEVTMVEGGIERRRQRLAAGNKGPPSPAAVTVVFLVPGLVLYDPLDNLFDVANLDEDILGL